MFIYMIEVGELKYIGFDTKPSYKQSRWKSHCRKVSDGDLKYKVHRAMSDNGVENCNYRIIENGFDDIVSLAIAEMNYIKMYDTNLNGLNSTYGGDGMGKHLHTMTSDEINRIKQSLSERMSTYNTSVKWNGLSADERKMLTKHLHNDLVYQKKSNTLLQYYKNNPAVAATKGDAISQWQIENRENMIENNKINSEKAAQVNRKPVKVQLPCGDIKVYNSRAEFASEHGHILQRILKKTKNGDTHKGWKAWDVNNDTAI